MGLQPNHPPSESKLDSVDNLQKENVTSETVNLLDSFKQVERRPPPISGGKERGQIFIDVIAKRREAAKGDTKIPTYENSRRESLSKANTDKKKMSLKPPRKKGPEDSILNGKHGGAPRGELKLSHKMKGAQSDKEPVTAKEAREATHKMLKANSEGRFRGKHYDIVIDIRRDEPVECIESFTAPEPLRSSVKSPKQDTTDQSVLVALANTVTKWYGQWDTTDDEALACTAYQYHQEATSTLCYFMVALRVLSIAPWKAHLVSVHVRQIAPAAVSRGWGFGCPVPLPFPFTSHEAAVAVATLDGHFSIKAREYGDAWDA